MNKRGHVLNAALLSVGLGVVLVWPTATTPGAEPVPAALDAVTTVVELAVPVVLGALFPDVDTAFGSHRKTLHNVFVLGLFLGFPILFGNLQYVWIGIATHYLLDVVGSRRGIAFLYPLTSEEWGMPTGVTTSSDYADVVTVVVTGIELAGLAAFHVYVMPLGSAAGTMSTMLAI